MEHDAVAQLEALRSESDALEIREFLSWAIKRFSPRLAFASSLGFEDQVLIHLLDEQIRSIPCVSDDKQKEQIPVEAFTLDTGRLFPETWDLLQRNHETFSLKIRIYAPDAADLEALVARQGPNGFYSSVEERKACCDVRKVRPLRRALSGKSAWITGLRRGQSSTRTGVERVEWDDANGLFKLNPLADWTLEQVQAFVARYHVPINSLHQRGMPSIGCQPCTRAVQPGADERSGRWWWEDSSRKECGLHHRDASDQETLGKRFSFDALDRGK